MSRNPLSSISHHHHAADLVPKTTPTEEPATDPAGGRAIEVAAMLGDSVVDVKHLSEPRAGRVSRTTYALFIGGAAMLLMAGVAFFTGVSNAEFNKQSKAAWVAENQAVHDWRPRLISPALDWMALGGLASGLFALSWGLVRIRNERVSPYFRIGSDAEVEFPTSAAPGRSFALVAPRGDHFVCNFTPEMAGELAIDGHSTSLAAWAAQGHARASESAPGALEMTIPERARVKLRAGQNTFLISSVPRPRKHAMPLWGSVESRALAFFAGSAVVHLGIWAFLNTLPPSPASLTMDFNDKGARLTRVMSKPNEDPVEDTQPADEQASDAGGSGAAMALESGKMGNEKSQRESGRYQIERTSDTPQISRETATRQAREAGIVGILRSQNGSVIASLTGTGDFSSAFDDATIYGGLLGDEAGEMKGGFGFGRSGFGPGGGGTGWATIGAGDYGTIGQGDGTGTGYHVGSGRDLGRHRKSGVPPVKIGQAVLTEGLDKNTIRRYIRQRLPRIKYCYEKQLLVSPGLAGTVLSDFQISPQGAVISSSATGVSDEVSSCVADVISTVHFPRTKNGLVVQVKYPFTFRPSGN